MSDWTIHFHGGPLDGETHPYTGGHCADWIVKEDGGARFVRYIFTEMDEENRMLHAAPLDSPSEA